MVIREVIEKCNNDSVLLCLGDCQRTGSRGNIHVMKEKRKSFLKRNFNKIVLPCLKLHDWLLFVWPKKKERKNNQLFSNIIDEIFVKCLRQRKRHLLSRERKELFC